MIKTHIPSNIDRWGFFDANGQTYRKNQNILFLTFYCGETLMGKNNLQFTRNFKSNDQKHR